MNEVASSLPVSYQEAMANEESTIATKNLTELFKDHFVEPLSGCFVKGFECSLLFLLRIDCELRSWYGMLSLLYICSFLSR